MAQNIIALFTINHDRIQGAFPVKELEEIGLTVSVLSNNNLKEKIIISCPEDELIKQGINIPELAYNIGMLVQSCLMK